MAKNIMLISIFIFRYYNLYRHSSGKVHLNFFFDRNFNFIQYTKNSFPFRNFYCSQLSSVFHMSEKYALRILMHSITAMIY
jgi:hypothetical protein